MTHRVLVRQPPCHFIFQTLLIVGGLLAPRSAAWAQAAFDTVTFQSTAQSIASFNGHVQFDDGSFGNGIAGVTIALPDGTDRSTIPCTRITEYHPKHVPGRIRVVSNLTVSGSTRPGTDPGANPRLFNFILQGWTASDEYVVLAKKEVFGRSSGMKSEPFGSRFSPSGTNFTSVNSTLALEIESSVQTPVFSVYASICELTPHVFALGVVDSYFEIASPQ